ncbi:MAG: response regulator transcription factor [Lentisphaerae bacterium]|nr:response regulator transcription factor [Lentisphaerota bacterium]
MSEVEVRVVLVDDHSVVLTGLEHALKDEEGLQVTGMVTSGEEAIPLVKKTRPDVVVLDMRMPHGLSGTETARVLLSFDNPPALIGMSHSVPGYEIMEFLRIGGLGFVMQEVADTHLATAIRSVVRGERFVCPASQKLVAEAKERWRQLGYHQLTLAELEILAGHASGLDRMGLAEFRNIKQSTVNVHLANIQQKLRVSTPVQLALDARSVGIGVSMGLNITFSA